MRQITNIDREITEVVNNWALSVIQRLEREHPEVLDALLNEDKNKEANQYDQRGNKGIPKGMAKETS
jgi:hypothetical protein